MGRVTQRRTIARVTLTPHQDEPHPTAQGAVQALGQVADHAAGHAQNHAAAPAGNQRDLRAAPRGGVVVKVGPDTLVAEEPLEIRVGTGGTPRPPLAVTMRTPGDDLDLAIGFLMTEGVIRAIDDVRTAQLCAGDQEPNTYNVVDVVLAAGVPAPEVDPARNFYTTSSCGVCGKASIDAVRTRSRFDVAADPVTVEPVVLAALPDTLREGQRAFKTTGGLHAAGLFDANGTLVCLREDVGRHNAVDKVIGWAARQGRLPLAGHVLMVSGRASFELAQKAWMAGIPVLAAVSAPSTLAVDLAAEAGLTLIGFLRGPTFNVYCGAQRVAGLEQVAGPVARSAGATAATAPGPGSRP
ncbi:formate dehydrogenase accessory sulfurtransferase FdhD [Dactylosporangium sp. NPDC005555]|uniref:formate dehydrogenase accessory sulfurtransferase FdhD n=1 Tax=Dactylosporangium sp. NPDC005555 TaxID=3154889 RepID=UPI0033ADCA60